MQKLHWAIRIRKALLIRCGSSWRWNDWLRSFTGWLELRFIIAFLLLCAISRGQDSTHKVSEKGRAKIAADSIRIADSIAAADTIIMIPDSVAFIRRPILDSCMAFLMANISAQKWLESQQVINLAMQYLLNKGGSEYAIDYRKRHPLRKPVKVTQVYLDDEYRKGKGLHKKPR